MKLRVAGCYNPRPVSTRVYMHTLGCPKNRVDSEVMLGTLSQAGYRLVQEPARADVAEVQETLRVAIRRWFRREVGKRPTVLPVVLEL